MDNIIIYVIGIFALIFTIPFVYLANKYSRVFWYATVRLSRFSEAERNIFIDIELERNEATRLHNLVIQAKTRITKKFGSMISSPVVIVVDEHKNARRYGLGPGQGNVRACITPWGTYLVIKSSTLDIDLIAHEYFHIEISNRIGYLAFKTKLPVWLDEGLALQVDYRKRFMLDKQPIKSSEINRVKKLRSSSEFFTVDNELYIRNMLAAKAAVHEILNQHSSESLYFLLSRVKKGEDIPEVFVSKKIE